MRIFALFRLIRPLNGLIGGISVFVGGFLTQKELRSPELPLACLVCFLIISAGNSLNDWADAEIDKINKPKKPIPSGKFTRPQVLVISIILFVFGLFISLKLPIALLFIALFASLLLLLYNFRLKAKGLSGNLIVAILGGLPFIYGGVVLGDWLPTLIPFGFAFLLHFAREILKDIEDIPGDRNANNVSFPIKYGVRKAILLSNLILGVLIAFTFLPFFIGWYGVIYLIGVILCIDLSLGLTIYKLRQVGCDVVIASTYVSKACDSLKFTMLIGLAVLSLGYY